MKVLEQKNRTKKGIRRFFKMATIIIVVLGCVTGCKKAEGGSGKLEVQGESYFLNDASWMSSSDVNEEGILVVFGPDAVVHIRLMNALGKNIPTGTFALDGSSTYITYIRILFGNDSDNGVENSKLVIKKSGRMYEITLTGSVTMYSGHQYEYKMTYKGSVVVM